MNKIMRFQNPSASKRTGVNYLVAQEALDSNNRFQVNEPALAYGKSVQRYNVPAVSDFTISEYKIVVPLHSLVSKKLKQPIWVTLENDDSGFIAQAIDMPLYGYSEYPQEAIDNLKHEIESLYENLLEDNNFSKEWLEIKKALISIIE